MCKSECECDKVEVLVVKKQELTNCPECNEFIDIKGTKIACAAGRTVCECDNCGSVVMFVRNTIREFQKTLFIPHLSKEFIPKNFLSN